MEVAKVARQRFLDDVTNSVGETFLAHSLQCARCHDHKFDPIPTRDYYSLQAVFATTQLAERDAPFLPQENLAGFEERKYLQLQRDEHLAVLARLDDELLASAQKWFREKQIDPAKWNAAVESLAKKRPNNPRREFKDVFGAARDALRKAVFQKQSIRRNLSALAPKIMAKNVSRARGSNACGGNLIATSRLRWQSITAVHPRSQVSRHRFGCQ